MKNEEVFFCRFFSILESLIEVNYSLMQISEIDK